MIHIFGTVSGTHYHAVLPWSLSWSVNNPRQQATRIALGGNEIQQTAAKSTSAGTARYSFDVPTDQAAIVDRLDYAASECVVSDGEKAWVATLDSQLLPTNTFGKTNLTVNFRIIRRIA